MSVSGDSVSIYSNVLPRRGRRAASGYPALKYLAKFIPPLRGEESIRWFSGVLAAKSLVTRGRDAVTNPATGSVSALSVGLRSRSFRLDWSDCAQISRLYRSDYAQ